MKNRIICNDYFLFAYYDIENTIGVCQLTNIRIKGGVPLTGSVCIQGSKNAALPMMAAALLHEGITVLNNCPRITDVFCMEEILNSLGVKTSWKGNRITIDCSCVLQTHVASCMANCMRSSIILMGSMLGRKGCISIAYPGGCIIGKRPIDIHIHTFQQMGIYIEECAGILNASVKQLKGEEIHFPKSSVGATENALLAAVLAKGTTILHNCSFEPEVIHLCGLLNAMGADITGIGTGILVIRGKQSLHDTEYTVPADRIAAGTYLYAGAITRGKITLINPPMDELTAILEVYEKMGGQYEVNSGKLVSNSNLVSEAISFVETSEYPGFPTDMQSVLMAVMTTLNGTGQIRENIFEDRYKIVPQLNRMGANILLDGRDALIEGGCRLTGCHIFAEELRGGAALILAGLSARGTTVIDNPHFIDRGYEDIEGVITALGGKIERNTGE